MWGDLMRVIPIIASLGTIATACMLFIRPLREKMLGTKAIEEGQRCLLRSDMLQTYYKHKDEGKIRQHELENFLLEYDAYEALHGNSFVKNIKSVVVTWEVIT